jgi:hydroxyethylthiazole kinase-like uncharacterized protein yjeF
MADMQLVISPQESARLDAESSVPVEQLMERAGMGVAIAASRVGASYGDRVAVLAGKGNNGGDGYVAARHLARRGCAVTVHALVPPEGAAATAADRAKAAGVAVTTIGSPTHAHLVVDAVFGTGFRGVLPGVLQAWIGHDAPVLAVDVPSGLDAATGNVSGGSFSAVKTVTFHALKPGHLLGEGPERCGEVEVIDIGLVGGQPELLVCDERDALRPARARDSHKWAVGSVAVVGGSPGLTGAPLLTATSALEFGAGAVILICPRALQSTYAAASAQVMTMGVGSGARFSGADVDDVLAAAARYDVLVLGPGLGAGQEDFVAGVVAGQSGKLIVDADGLNSLAGPDALAERAAPTMITPHAGEFQRLTGKRSDYKIAAGLTDSAGVVVVLKGNPTFVLGSERWVVRSGGPELATIGSGDVLAGMIGSLWARGLDGDVAARSAAYWHGRAGADRAVSGTVTAETLARSVGAYAF